MSETPIGDEIMGQEQLVDEAAVDPLTEAAQDVVVMEDPYRIPGEDDADEADPEAADASGEDALVEPTDNSGEALADADEVPQAPDAVEDDPADDEPDAE